MKKISTARIALLVLATITAACASTETPAERTRRLLDGANKLQAAAGESYDQAKLAEDAASKRCTLTARSTGQGAPEAVRTAATTVTNLSPSGTTIAALRAACRALGVEVPFDPFLLQAIGTDLRKAYDAIRLAGELEGMAEKGLKDQGEVSAAVGRALSLVSSLYGEAAAMGLSVDPAKARALVAEATEGGAR